MTHGVYSTGVLRSATAGRAAPGREATTRAPSQREKLLAILRSRGSAGATNEELNRHVGFRYGARIFELRRMGYGITTWRESETVFRFVLVDGQPAGLFGGAH